MDRLAKEMMRLIGSVWLIILISLLIGVGYGYQTTRYFVRYGLGPTSGAVSIGIVKELIPLLVALILSGWVGVAWTAETASMKITEQISALRTLGVSPVKFLVIPRVIACIIFHPVLVCFAGLACFFGQFFTALSLGVSASTFLYMAKDFFQVYFLFRLLIKASIFGFGLALISSYSGLYLKKKEESSAGIGKASIRSVVMNFFFIFLVNFLFSLLNN
ncbi:ABC transporter permease [bacterium]|nr:ABC transporter permease [bacterium]